MAAKHFLQESGFRGSFELVGSLSSGISVRNLNLESDTAVARLTVARLTPVYQMRNIVMGRLDGIEVDGLHADLRLGLAAATSNEKESLDLNALDLESLVKTLRELRSKIIPVDADLKDISLNVSRAGRPVFSLDRSRIRHQAGEPNVDLEIGVITDATDREWPTRESSIVWNEDELTIDRLDPMPGLSVRALVVQLPAAGGPSAEMEVHLDDAVFLLSASPGFSSVLVNLSEGRLMSEQVAARFDVKLPVSGNLTSLSLNIEGLFPDPQAANGSLEMVLENISDGEWVIPELSLDVGLEADRATAMAHGLALDTDFSVNAEAALSRGGGGIRLADTRGHFKVAEVSKLVAALAEKIKAIDPDAPVPTSTADGDFHLSFRENQPDLVEVNLRLKPSQAQAVASFEMEFAWRSDQTVSMTLATEGVNAHVDVDVNDASYDGCLDLTDFKSVGITPWLKIAKLGTVGEILLSGTWHGRGDLDTKTHQGAVSLTSAELSRAGMPPIHAQAGIEYDWPSSFTTKDLQVQVAGQSVAADLKIADGFLSMSGVLWQDGDKQMASGSARLPVPEVFSKWRERLARDTRPLNVSIQSKALSLERLKDWLPAVKKLDPRSTGQVEISVSGTYAEPMVDAVVEVGGLRLLEQPDLPPADLMLKLAASDGQISLDGSATLADFPSAVVTASMPFRPAEWVATPGLVMDEQVAARVDLPRIDFSRLAALVPAARTVSGTMTGSIDVAGRMGAPCVKGRIDLTDGGLELKTTDIPAISGLAATVDLTLDRITLKQLKATVAGGTLHAEGSLSIEDGMPGALDFQLQASHLPIKRDESLIVRANADLRLAGSWEQAALTGSVGVVDSIFFRDIELLPIGSPFTGPSTASLPKFDAPVKSTESVPEPFRNWSLNVVAKTENPFLIRGNLATGKVEGKLRIGGTLGKIAPDGELQVADLVAKLPFSTLRVSTCTLRFVSKTGFDAILELRGTAEPRPYQVNVFVYGRASDPQVVLTSNPPLPENEIMTLLATGTTTAGLEDPQVASSRAMQLLAEELRRGRFGVGKELRPLLGVMDRVDFTLAEDDPYSSESFSSATLRLTDRWSLSAGMGRDGYSRVLASWQLRFY